MQHSGLFALCVFKQRLTRIGLRLLVSDMHDGAAVAALRGDGHHTLGLAGQREGRQRSRHHSSRSRWWLLWVFYV